MSDVQAPALLPNDPPGWSDLPAGWVGVFNAAVAYLDENLEGWRVVQVKQKYAALRIYYDEPEGTDRDTVRRVSRAIDEILAESERTCEVCGRPGALDQSNRYWWRSVCEEHRGSIETPEAELRWREGTDGPA
ncbi:unannotated protein [freshwater metagenome]|uniref:Unannotated protein n=1 Tax=freshwater metagenome TaxID=449393 RepID=A0A6J6RZ27_9ZZZZ|nr:hypothetical protein [Actinomycetota bacterium]